MQLNRKALLAALLVSLPAPFFLGLLLQVSNITLAGGTPDNLVAYGLLYLLFVVMGLLTVLLATARPGPRLKAAANELAPNRAAAGPVTLAKGEEEGTVKWFNVKKGFGFITRENGDDIFVHFRAIQGHGRRVLRQGQRVKYHVVDADKGLQANDVTVTDGSDEE
ncbi:MAG: cold shock domain-containing protein [Halomonadaceae bacterium]|nr:MAG: cold shock domain-containing protein [Halomonadaceae bacterium]